MSLKNLNPKIETVADCNGFLLADAASLHVLFFWASWDDASKEGGAMDTFLTTLAEKYPQCRFGRVEAENAVEVSELFDISAVPTFVFVKNKSVVDKVEGPDAPAVTARVAKWERATTNSLDGSNVLQSIKDLDAELDRLVNAAPVMIFIKGTPTEPRCKFTRALLELLKEENIVFGSFDILSNESVRQGLKEKFNWPTYPQVYVNGSLIGGIDIMKEMKESGDLATVIPHASIKTPSDVSSSVIERIQSLLNSSPCVLAMKGTISEPACGFSESMVKLLKSENIEFSSFDVLKDSVAREALKVVSGHNTFPQLYVSGKFVGGVDEIMQKKTDAEAAGSTLASFINAPTKESLEVRLRRLINQKRVVLFMKGSPSNPRCGFSAKCVDRIKSTGLDVSPDSKFFGSFDILEDDEVRQGLKEFSNWPTYPQLYIDGELIGGFDIIEEMAASNELSDLFNSF